MDLFFRYRGIFKEDDDKILKDSPILAKDAAIDDIFDRSARNQEVSSAGAKTLSMTYSIAEKAEAGPPEPIPVV